ncbi:MAG: 50S ribosomal protein L3 [Cardiobacteriaceae bacterium]|nr:50S ribosomal protein L3 [Cardiobacteriaceae bacterium]
MTMGLVGQKVGMTRIFNADGSADAVTVIEVKPNVVSQLKTVEGEGYSAVQVSTGEKKVKHLSKALIGHFKKAGITAGAVVKEFRVEEADLAQYTVGAEIKVDFFENGQRVDVRGRSIGKGFAGTIKRHHFSGQRKTHGNSLSHRVPGSIGQNQTPGRVFKGKRMAGHLGNRVCSIQNLEILRVDVDNNLLLIKGAVPGAKGGYVVIRPSIKA